MKKKVAKIFKKYGDGKIEVIKKYQPITKADETSAVKGTRGNINRAIGTILLKGSKEEQKLVGKTMQGDYLEDWDFKDNLVIKY